MGDAIATECPDHIAREFAVDYALKRLKWGAEPILTYLEAGTLTPQEMADVRNVVTALNLGAGQ